MQPTNFYKNIWTKKIGLKDRLLFGLMLVLISGFYFYSVFRRNELVSGHIMELGICLGFLLLIMFVKIVGNILFKIWLSISGTFGQIVFFIIQFMAFYLILTPVYILVNLMKKKNRSIHSNWSTNPHKNTNYKNPG